MNRTFLVKNKVYKSLKIFLRYRRILPSVSPAPSTQCQASALTRRSTCHTALRPVCYMIACQQLQTNLCPLILSFQCRSQSNAMKSALVWCLAYASLALAQKTSPEDFPKRLPHCALADDLSSSIGHSIERGSPVCGSIVARSLHCICIKFYFGKLFINCVCACLFSCTQRCKLHCKLHGAAPLQWSLKIAHTLYLVELAIASPFDYWTSSSAFYNLSK